MPDLGKYEIPVLGSFGAALLLIAVLVALSLWRGARVKRALRVVEERQGRHHG